MKNEGATQNDVFTPVNADSLRRAMRRFASGVTIVTSQHNAEAVGITVSAFSSISLDPPVVMISINRASSAAPVILNAESFAVHILSSEQEMLSVRFAESLPWEEKLGNSTSMTGLTGIPILSEAFTAIECWLINAITIGTHSVMFGQVVGIYLHETTPETPLLYYDQNYRTLDRIPEDPTD
ncbi:MAG: flavin reductase [Ignavibacteriae bacterium]|nr:flavin reductase [Ignavibacteriota bacterium]MCB9216948.1 flavin reductase [Ignavibacteria bacterium]